MTLNDGERKILEPVLTAVPIDGGWLPEPIDFYLGDTRGGAMAFALHTAEVAGLLRVVGDRVQLGPFDPPALDPQPDGGLSPEDAAEWERQLGEAAPEPPDPAPSSLKDGERAGSPATGREVAAKPRKPARTGAETRAPAGQNEYMRAVINSHQLGSNAKFACLIAAVEMGLEGYKRGKKFEDVTKELTAAYMAGKMKVSHDTARKAMTAAVKLGFMLRTDNGKGGRGGTGKSTYRPVLPGYLNSLD